MMAPDAHNGAKCPGAGAVWDSNPGPPTEPHKSRGCSTPQQECAKHAQRHSSSAKNAQTPLMGIKTLDQHTTLIYELLLKSIEFDI